VRCSDSSRGDRNVSTMPAGWGSVPGGARRHGSTVQCGASGAAQSWSVDTPKALYGQASRKSLERTLIYANLSRACSQDTGPDHAGRRSRSLMHGGRAGLAGLLRLSKGAIGFYSRAIGQLDPAISGSFPIGRISITR